MRYGTRTYGRKGYWLTALAAAVLLAVSPGTASAQVTPDTEFDTDGFKVDGLGKTIKEGDATVITVTLRGEVQAENTATEVTVTVTIEDPAAETPNDDTTDNADDGDVTLTGDDGTGVEVTLAFPAGGVAGTDAVTYTRSANVYLGTGQDGDAEDEDFAVGFAVDGTTGVTQPNMQVIIDDDETQTYVLTLETDEPTEGTDISVSLKAEPAHDEGSLLLTLHSSDPKYTPNPATATISGTNRTETIAVEPPDNDGNRVEDSVTLTAYSGAVGRSTEQDSLTIKVADANALPAVAARVVDKDGKALDPQPTSVEEGTSIMVAVMPVDKDGDAVPAKEKLTVALTPAGTADAADYTLVGAFTIENTMKASNRVELKVRTDEDVGMESLMFDATVSGDSKTGTETSMSAGVLTLAIGDATTKKIEPKATDVAYPVITGAMEAAAGEEGLNPGESFSFMTGDLFTVTDGYTASYSVSVEGDSVSASASGDSVTVDAKSAGESKVTVTGTARMPGSSLMPSQTVSNVASLTFPVMVVDTTLVVTLSADPMEIEAGGTTMITATANRAVTAGDGAVEVTLAVVGDGTLDAKSITIAMDAMSGSAMLTANESVTVVATGSGVSGLMQVMVTVVAAAEPVPALGLIAQWLLGLGLLGGGARQLYRRRRQG